MANDGAVCAWGSVMRLPGGTKTQNYSKGTTSDLAALLSSEHRHEFPRSIQNDQVVIASDVHAADVDLRNGPSAGLLHHFRAALGVEVHAYFLDHPHPLGVQQPFSPDAVRANGGRIHHYRRRHRQPFSSGMPASA